MNDFEIEFKKKFKLTRLTIIEKFNNYKILEIIIIEKKKIIRYFLIMIVII